MRLLLSGDCWTRLRGVLLGTTNLYNGMILSTLSISSHDFALGFLRRSHTNEDTIPCLKPMIIP